MSQQMIEVSISNKEMGEAPELLSFILDKLHTAGVPQCTCTPGQAIKPANGILMYTRNSMNQASVYTWQPDDYVRGHDNEDTTIS